jgi:CRISPR-associated endonuclease/helicase Cas3
MKSDNDRFSSLDDLWAKSSGQRRGLIEHTEDVLEALEEEIQRHRGLIQLVAERLHAHFPQSRTSADYLIREVRLAALCHDLGKATVSFQEYLRTMEQWAASGRHGPRPKVNYIHHRFASLPFIKAAIVSQEKKALYSRGHLHFGLAVVAILTHHGRFSSYLEEQGRIRDWADQRAMIERQIDYIDELLPTLWEWMNKWLLEWHYQKALWSTERFQCLLREFDLWHAGLLGSEAYPGQQIADRIEPIDRLALSLIKGLLMIADWQASGHYRPPYEVLERLEGYLYLGTAQRAFDAGRLVDPEEFGWNDSQKAMAQTKGNALCVVACGQGKTEAAGLWAAADPQRRPLIYLMPTQVTSTKLADRLSEYLPRRDEFKAASYREPVDPIGLIHGSARYHRLKDADDNLADVVKQHLDASRCFALPVTVATVDQALMAFFNGGYWSQTTVRLAEANIIFDEIHAYEPYTLGLILSMIEQLRELRARFAFLSATMPQRLQEELKRAAGGACDIPHGNDPTPRWRLHLKESHPLRELLPEAIRRFDNGDKVLVIANTIGHAIEIYNAIEKSVPGEQRMLLHSMFMQKDRSEKEGSLEKISSQEGPFFLVATQVVEVSLDISFDFLLTEAATVDALVQRLGRVNRYGELKYADVWISIQDKRSEKIYELDLVELSLKELKTRGQNGILTEHDYRDAVDVVYNAQWQKPDYREQLQKGRQKALEVQQQLSYIYDLIAEEAKLVAATTRPNDYPKTEIVPRVWEDETSRTIEEEYEDTCEKPNGLTLAQGFIVRVPLWWVYGSKRIGVPKECPHGHILNVKYSREFGVLHEEASNQI